MTTTDALSRLVEQFPMRAGAFIVTLYGDVVAPRGGELWMGNIVETCARAGIAESRVRTSVSRLVAAARIEGKREGRRSFYHLTPEAICEFQKAARQIYKCQKKELLSGWHLVLLPQGAERDEASAMLRALRAGFPLPGVGLLPDRGEEMPVVPGVHFVAKTEDDLSDLVGSAWPLDEINSRCERFIAGFSDFVDKPVSQGEALVLRLLLVHNFRGIALDDPDLPEAFLPKGWLGRKARALFAKLYLSLLDQSDAEITKSFIDSRGALQADRVRLARRIADLSTA